MRRGLMIGALVVAAIAAVVVAVIALGGGEPEPQPSPTPTPSPTPSPTPEIEDVDGVLQVEQRSVAVSGNQVFVEGSSGDRAPEIDEGAVDSFTTGIKDWLDQHLDLVQRGRFTASDAALPFDVADDAPLLAAVSTDLANPDDPIKEASYEVTVYVDGVPEWASVVAVLELEGGQSREASYVFVPGGDEPRLIAASPGGDR